MAIATEDYSAVSDFLGRYFWYVDENMPEEWISLWTEDGLFSMPGLELAGREKLKGIPRLSFELSDGKMRHMFSNLFCDYGDDRDTVIAIYDELVTNWKSGGAFQGMGVCKAQLVRDGAGWMIKRNDVRMLR